METDAIILKMVRKSGFVEAFWEVLSELRQFNPDISQRTVYEQLNEMYEAEFGEPRFASFDAFRKYRDRHS